MYNYDPENKIHEFQAKAVDAILSALGPWLLKILQVTKVLNTKDGIEVHINAGQTKINILQPVSDARMLDVVWLALENGAPLHPEASSWNDIKDDKKKIQEALAKMIELLSSFNDQMRKATSDCMQIPWQLATAQYPNMLEPNVLAGIAVWTLMAGGHGGVEGLPWVPDRPTLGSRFSFGLCQVPAHKTVSGGFPRVFRFPQLLL